MTPVTVFRVKPPKGAMYFSAIVEDDDGKLITLSTKSGDWEPDDTIAIADLLMPEQDLNEWDIYPVKADDAPPFKDKE